MSRVARTLHARTLLAVAWCAGWLVLGWHIGCVLTCSFSATRRACVVPKAPRQPAAAGCSVLETL
eukprot:2935366-Prymnesium_polylepis.1